MAAAPAQGPAAAPAQGPEAEFVKSVRGGDKLVCEGFVYRKKDNLKEGAKFWECDQRDKGQCKASCKTVKAGEKIVVQDMKAHNHLPSPETVTQLRLKTEVRKQAVAQPTATVSNLAAASLQKVDKADLPYAPSNLGLKRTAWRARSYDQQKKLRDAGHAAPEPNYATLTDFVLPEVKVHQEEFLLYDSGPGAKRIVLFGTQSTLDALRNSETWLADGTFKTAPKLFAQVYTIHAMDKGFDLPSIYALLLDKTSQTYQRLWKVVHDLVEWDGVRELTLLVDFEKAAYGAFIAIFRGCDVHGCFFHFKQAIHRKIQELGLQTKYTDNLAFRVRISSLGALSFVPPDHVKGAFNDLAGFFEDDEKPLLQYLPKRMFWLRLG